ncbi:MAG: flagellar hook-basal body protein [Oscillospiraceae bacterium]|jgi:flagellar basal-body rod protein FlgG|nr:flagellar hook-basal body protein [Oscillospiraceae bacterium]
MLRGFYTAASGIISQQTRLNAISNNIANSSTAGYKRDEVTLSTFGEHIAVRMNTYEQSPLHRQGDGVWMQVTDEEHTNHEQGGFDFTNSSLDMAVQGEGFFVVNTQGGERLTRDGQFALDEEGFLVLPGFGRVQGEGGDIQIGTSNFSVSTNGTIYAQQDIQGVEEPVEIDRLLLAIPEDYAAMEKDSGGLFISENYAEIPAESAATVVRQGATEKSNVNMGNEMTKMIAAQRSLQSASQIVKMYDSMSEQGVSSLSRI